MSRQKALPHSSKHGNPLLHTQLHWLAPLFRLAIGHESSNLEDAFFFAHETCPSKGISHESARSVAGNKGLLLAAAG